MDYILHVQSSRHHYERDLLSMCEYLNNYKCTKQNQSLWENS